MTPKVNSFTAKPHRWKPGTMVKTITINPRLNDLAVIPMFRVPTAPADSFMNIRGGLLVMYTDCDAELGGTPRMYKIIYGEYIGWVHCDNLTSM
jgi:hypothetical protein